MADTNKPEGKSEGEGFFARVKDALDAPVTKVVGYFEREDYVPDPYAQRGQVDTTDTAGTVPDVNEVSHVFAEARARNMQTAARALDPNDPSVPEELVTLPQGQVTVVGTVKTADEGREDVVRAVQGYVDNPVEIGGLTPAQQLAAEDTSDSSTQDADNTEDPGKTEAKKQGGQTRPSAQPAATKQESK
jgi:hypothetical protein